MSVIRYFANPVSETVRDAMQTGRLGYIDTPGQGNRRPDGVVWCADNGCFSSKWEPESWWRWLNTNGRGMVFATVPDVVSDWPATFRLFEQWAPRMVAEGFPVAVVAQNGATADDIPYDQTDAVFIGGSTEWKLSTESERIIRETKRRGLYCHVGRVNSFRRLRWAHDLGADSADGTFLTFGPDTNLKRLTRWLDRLETQPSLLRI